MKLNNYIQTIQIHLIQTHSKILDWFTVDEKLKNYQPDDGGWSIIEILEHIALTSFFLLKLIDKGADKALRNVRNLSLEEEKNSYHFETDKFEKIGLHKSFIWIRPEHMEPTREKSELAIKDELITQMNRCLHQLTSLKNGEGLLYTTTMTVNDLGKLTVYEYIYFLSKHAERHLTQMEANKIEFQKKQS